MSGEIEKIQETREKLDEVSSSFCLAKWLQVTIRLQNGTTHSCHHPEPHKVPLGELLLSPNALHNTSFKKEQRQAMLQGKRPDECSYCWKIEDIPGKHISDRHIKSHDPWARPHLSQIAALDWNADVNPTYLEVSFSNTCNFKCAYCSPLVSSKWMEEIRALGPYPTSQPFNDLSFLSAHELLPIPESEPNPYVDAFWKWWPELYKTLEVFRVTGGEPLLSPHTFRALDYIAKNPRPEMELAINSNLGVPDKLIHKFADALESITQQNKVKNFRLYVSLDTWGEQAEYIRFGLNFKRFWKNVRYLLERLPRIQIVFMCTFNALSVAKFAPFVEALLELKEEFYSEERYFKTPAILDVSYLRYPDFLSSKILPEPLFAPMHEIMSYMDSYAEEQYKPYHGFYDFERAKVRRLIEYMREPENPLWLKRARQDFSAFIREYDQRRGTRFENVFPELRDLISAD